MKYSVTYASMTLLIFSHAVWADEPVQFDKRLLQSYDLDISIADYLAYSNKLAPGPSSVRISLNQRAKGQLTVWIDPKGKVCLPTSSLTMLALKQSGLPVVCSDNSNDYIDLLKSYPGAQAEIDPLSESIALVMPESWLQGNPLYQQGGWGGALNYNVYTARNQGNYGNNSTSYGNFETGVNFDGWLLRGWQNAYLNNSQASYRSYSNYLQTSVRDNASLLQLGQVTSRLPLFSVPSVLGVQETPDMGFINSQSGIIIQGIANTPQSRVEIRQFDQLIYSTIVEQGAFTLSDLPLINQFADLDVKVIGSDGNVDDEFTISPSAMAPQNTADGFSYLVGRVDSYQGIDQQPWMLAGTYQSSIDTNTHGLVGSALADQYFAIGAQVSTHAGEWWTSASSVFAHDDLHNKTGIKGQLNAGLKLTDEIEAQVGTTLRSQGFRELSNTLYDTDSGVISDRTWSIGLSSALPYNARGSVGYTMSSSSRRLFTSIGGKVGKAQLSSSLSHTNYSGRKEDYSFALNLSYPLSLGMSASAYIRNSSTQAVIGSTLNGQLGRDYNYRLNVEEQDGERYSTSVGLSGTTPVTHFSTQLSANNDGSRNSYLSLSGGVVLHEKGVTTSPRPVGDTYALVSLSEPMAGVEVSSPGGRVWTDSWGNAVIPNLSPYQRSEIKVVNKSLPKNIDVMHGVEFATPARGAVLARTFAVKSTRPMVIELSMVDGTPVPMGTVVVDEERDYVTTMVDHGLLVLNDTLNSSNLTAVSGRNECAFTIPDGLIMSDEVPRVMLTCQ